MMIAVILQSIEYVDCEKKHKIETQEIAAALLPDDLIAEILSWLAPKCVGRCKIVCKLWRAIIQSRHFIEQHMQRQDYIIVYSITLLETHVEHRRITDKFD
ncbi:hypothetical protein LIER_34151 [Lithospermum erythrorhizon]|uniref:F-box domain-containing protein n=1 Tax=Lithospermum erythrorhizon TaxID=34254 RepID=A0AAV3S0K3_LITER